MKTNNKIKCKGLMGLLFGHKYKIVYDTDIEDVPASQKILLLSAISQYNNNALYTKQITPDIDLPKRITKVYRCHICERCGDTIEQKPLTL